MQNLTFPQTFTLLIVIFSLCMISCGDDEPECVVPTSSFELTIDGETITTGNAFGDISNPTLGGFDVKYLDIFINLEDGREFIIGIQNIDATVGGLCVENRNYEFSAEDADCFDIDSTTTICNEADIEYTNVSGTRLTDFLQDGTLTITSCNIDKNTISGSFSGELASFTATEPTPVSGTFTNILIEE